LVIINRNEDLIEGKKKFSKKYIIAVIQAIFVTVLWSSSWLLIKWGLEDENIPPLFYSGLRYFLASIILIFYVVLKNDVKNQVSKIRKKDLGYIAIYGLFFITFTQGGMFLSLFFLEAITVSLILNFTIVAVLFFSLIFLKESINKTQFFLILVALLGIIFYFDDKITLEFSFLGLFIGILAMLANAGSSIMGRSINRDKRIGAVLVTTISMAFGSTILLIIALIVEPIPILSLTSIIYIVWLSIFNTALAFTIWNKTMQTLRAVDSTIINSTMTPQIVFLSVLFLGEQLNFLDWIGIILVILSVLFIQINQAQNFAEEK
jgi:drug/metabolite transporter (DMT)-like permease